MKVVIVGVGDVGKEVAEALARRPDNRLVLIDSDEHRCEALSSTIDALVLHGDGTDPRLLAEAGVADSDALIATTGSDSLNTVIAMLGHQTSVKRIMVKLNDVWLRPACHAIGVSKVVAPKVSAAAELVGALYGFDRADFSLAVRGGLRVVELAAGAAQGKKLSDVDMPKGALVVAILRDEEAIVADPGAEVRDQDVLLVLVQNDDVAERVRKALSP